MRAWIAIFAATAALAAASCTKEDGHGNHGAHEAATAVYGDYDNTRRREIADHPALAASWRATLLHLASLES